MDTMNNILSNVQLPLRYENYKSIKCPSFNYWLNVILLLVSGLTIFMAGLGANIQKILNYRHYYILHL
jgi:hypothetical protein